MTPLERHCSWVLRAYPTWYRRERAAEMLGTLLGDHYRLIGTQAAAPDARPP
jgi:hypothetical protein